MAISKWHPGQLVVLWVGAAFIELLILLFFRDVAPSAIVMAAQIVFVAVPFLALAITWRWFASRPRR
jgi:hypothetical protein